MFEVFCFQKKEIFIALGKVRNNIILAKKNEIVYFMILLRSLIRCHPVVIRFLLLVIPALA